MKTYKTFELAHARTEKGISQNNLSVHKKTVSNQPKLNY